MDLASALEAGAAAAASQFLVNMVCAVNEGCGMNGKVYCGSSLMSAELGGGDRRSAFKAPESLVFT